MMKNLLTAAVMALILAAGEAGAAAYEVSGKLPLGGDGGWDYLSVDASARLLYLSRATHVVVVDLSTGTIAADIPDTPGVHGIALAQDRKRGYVSAGKADVVKVFDLKTRQILATIPVGSKPDAILYDPATRQVFAFNGESANVSVIDTSKDQVVATIPLPGAPEFARADGRGSIFVNIEDKNELAALDARARRVTAHWPLPQCERPTGLALDAAHARSFSVCGSAVMSILDTHTGRSVAVLPIGNGVDGAEFDPAAQDAFSANGEGTLTIVHEQDPEHFAVTQTLSTLKGARTLALDASTHTLYLPSAEFGPVSAGTADPHPRPPILPGTFFVLKVAPVAGTKPP